MGRASALAFAAEGARTVGVDLNGERNSETRRLLEEGGGTMVSHPSCDLTQVEACRCLVNFAVREFRRVDVVYNNAASGGMR